MANKKKMKPKAATEEEAERHGGWLQAQGLDMDPMQSYSWSRPDPIPSAEAALELDRVQARCTAEQQRRRMQAFPRARRFITRLAGQGIDAPVSRTWNDPGVPPKKARVDIEVKEGRAFV